MLLSEILELPESDKLLLMQELFKKEPYKWDFVTMPESLRRFYSNEKREDVKPASQTESAD